MRRLQVAAEIVMDAYWRLAEDDGWAIASHLAMSTLTSLFPFLIFVTALAGFFGSADLSESAASLLFDVWPRQVAGPIATEIHNVLTTAHGGLLTIGALLAVYFSSSGVEAFRIGLNRAYGVRERRTWWLLRLESIAYVLVGAVALLALAFLVVLAPLLWTAAVALAPELEKLGAYFTFARYALVSVILILALVIAHKWLPAGRRTFGQIAPGIVLTVLLSLLFSVAFGRYLADYARNYVTTYGGLASVMIALLFLYSLASIFVYGGELNAAIIRRRNAAAAEPRTISNVTMLSTRRSRFPETLKRSASADRLMVPDHLFDDELQELLREDGVEFRVGRKAAQPLDLHGLAVGIGRRQARAGLEFADRAGAAEPLGQDVDQGRVDVVDALPQREQGIGCGCSLDHTPDKPPFAAIRRGVLVEARSAARNGLRRLVDDAHMRRDDPPAFGQPRPALHLPADAACRTGAAKQRRGGREIGTERRDRGRLEHPGEARGGTRRPEGRDRGVPVEVLGHPVADRLGGSPEEGVERRDVVADERGLVGREGALHLGPDGGVVDDHVRLHKTFGRLWRKHCVQSREGGSDIARVARVGTAAIGAVRQRIRHRGDDL